MIEFAGIGGFILLITAVWAIVSIVGSSAGNGTKALWVVLVLLLPVIGFICWFLFGPKSSRRAV
ncbi:PLDc N-terminal domain-containing protein [Leisingera thetidis]|uniref:PLDc N-terminal domain-containing protein n=1 Tax=Leisingera thetidis TaxID=2930199 RepID=UPI0021F6AF3B|nr:PLDc N-terminal domain-containing protein [Leisingera thetidis]